MQAEVGVRGVQARLGTALSFFKSVSKPSWHGLAPLLLGSTDIIVSAASTGPPAPSPPTREPGQHLEDSTKSRTWGRFPGTG